HLAARGGGALPPGRGRAPSPGGGVPAGALGVGPVGTCSRCPVRRPPPVCQDGTARPIPRPNDPTDQPTCSRGKTKRPRRQTRRLLHAPWRLVCLRETPLGSVHDQRLADPTPSPRPAGRPRRHELGVPGGTLEGVEILQPTKKPRGPAWTPAQQADNRALARRRVRIAQVQSRVTRCRMRTE